MTVLCARDCTIRNRHAPTCPGDECRGCQPRQAAPGLNLCDLHTTLIATHAARCGELYEEIATTMTGTTGQAEPTSGTKAGTSINEKAMDMRIELRSVLASWCRLVAEERGITLPPDRVDAMGAWLATHHEWLAAHPLAGECSTELDDLSRRAGRVAHPSGTRAFDVGPCPAQGCKGTMRAVLRPRDPLLPSELVCDTTPDHTWTADRWREFGHTYRASGRYLTAAEIGEIHHIPLGTVYRLASVHHWRRTADGIRPVLYLTEDVTAAIRPGSERIGA